MKRAWASLPLGSKLINVYYGCYLALALAHWRGLISVELLTVGAVPVLLRWLVVVVRWIATGSPAASSTKSSR